MTWCSLINHSQYSVLQSTIDVKELVDAANSHAMPAVALTDSGNLFAAVEFYKAATMAKLRPIVGAQLYLSFGSRTHKARVADRPNYSSLVLLAKNAEGYKNLCKLSTVGYLEGFYYVPRVDREFLFEHSKGLICISGALGSYHGYFAAHRPLKELESECEAFLQAFGDDFILQLQRLSTSPEELERDGMMEEPWLIQKYEDFQQLSHRGESCVRQVSTQLNIPLVATQEAFYLDREEWKAHEILLNVQSGEPCEIWQRDSSGNPIARTKNPKRDVLASHEYYFKSPHQIEKLFHDVPSAISMSHEIANRCEFQIDFKSKHYPSFIPPGFDGDKKSPELLVEAVSKYLKNTCHAALSTRYNEAKFQAIAHVYPKKDPKKIIHDRLAMELETIISKGLTDYLLIVADFIQWAKTQGIPVGPGRGSGAGSIVCYLLGITDIEPLRFNLFFERFINPERVSYPDIDVDICMDRRHEVIDYMLHKYGRDNVAQIITFGTMKAKMSLKDVGRVLSVPLSKVNQLCKVLPDDINLTLEDALKDAQVQQMVELDEETKTLFSMAKILEGSIRNTGIHAAGLIICADPLVEHIPLCSSKDAQMPVTQYSMKPVESVGMLKIDFLGLKTLTSIQKCVEDIKRGHGVDINWFELPLDDSATFDLLNKGRTLGVFQLESGGMQDLSRQLHLDRFEEIIAVVSLYRPGPMDMIPSFINRKHKREPIEYDHPWLEGILAETYGIMVYQEQVMQIASHLAGFTLAEGDVLRRAMGKKDAQEMASQRIKFINGAKDKQINETISTAIFDKMEKFAAYGFNKSHAAAYGYIAYVTAYLKANYPREWMASLMTCDRHDLSKIAKFIAESRSMDIPILPPDINESGDEFRATPKGIRFALSAIKGIGGAVVEHLDVKRKEGFFQNLQDFLKRIDAKKVGKKTIELLIDAGAFDFTGWTRDALQISLEEQFIHTTREQQEAQRGVMTLFSLFEEEVAAVIRAPHVEKPRHAMQLLLKEKELLGFFLTGNPMKLYQASLSRLSCVDLTHVHELKTDTVLRTAFIIEEVAIKVSQKTQKKFAILQISDGQERFELPIWSDLFEKYAHLLQENRLLAAVLSVETQEIMRLSCRWLGDLTQLDTQQMQACDDAYDKAKMMMTMPRRNSAKNDAKKVEKEPAMREIELTLEASKLRFSHILQLKKVIQQYPGKDTLKLIFNISGRARTKTLHMDAKHAFHWDAQVQAHLMGFLPILASDVKAAD